MVHQPVHPLFQPPSGRSGGCPCYRHHPELQRQRRHPAGIERHRRDHLRQCHSHYHGSEHRHLRYRVDLLCGCQQECTPCCHGPSVLQHHRCDHLPCRLLRPEYGLPLCFCEHHHRGMGHRCGALGVQYRGNAGAAALCKPAGKACHPHHSGFAGKGKLCAAG